MKKEYFKTSPVFFFHAPQNNICARELRLKQKFKSISKEAFDIMFFFLNGRSLAEGVSNGFSITHINDAVKIGILINTERDDANNYFLWDKRNWSRAAYLLYSQQDLTYLESIENRSSLKQLSETRGDFINSYLDVSEYPKRLWAESNSEYILSETELTKPSLDDLVTRRSVRTFSSDPITEECLSNILFSSTYRLRMAENSKKEGDPYFLLNSFYTWLNIYIIIQGVEGIKRGVYQYDPFNHRLLKSKDSKGDVSDNKISSCIQYQDWIGGGGFSMFVVADWERYMWLYRHSRAYINLLIQAGEFAQEVLQASYSKKLGGWLTPAISESCAVDLLGINATREDAIYYIKIGSPKPQKE